MENDESEIVLNTYQIDTDIFIGVSLISSIHTRYSSMHFMMALIKAWRPCRQFIKQERDG